MNKFEFEGVAKEIPDNEIGIWTDGLCLSMDSEWLCAYKLEVGKNYRVTVEVIDEV